MLATIYLLTTIFFGGILIISFVLGEIAGGLGEPVESAGDLVEGWIGALTGLDVELTGDIGGGVAGPGFAQTLLIFFTSFGGGGYLALTRWHASEGWSVIVGLAFGVVMGGAAFVVFRYLAKTQFTGARSLSKLIGTTGVVRVTISSGCAGDISITGPVGRQTLTARADQEILKGTPIEIVSVEAGVVYVKPQVVTEHA